MGKDLDKLMGKLKKEKKAKKVEEDPEKEDPEKDVDLDEDDDDDDDDDEDKETKEETKEKPTEEELVTDEVALLQNDGVFRRELIITLRELRDVHKVNTQALLNIKKLIRRALNGKKE